MTRTARKPKVALLTNLIAPYRRRLYSTLANEFELLILHGGMEVNRDTWDTHDQPISEARIERAWGWQIRWKKTINGKVFDEKFIHITPGYLWHLLRFRPDAVISNELGFRSVVAVAYGTMFRRPVWIWWEGTVHSERNIGGVRKMLRKLIVLSASRWVSFGQTATAYLLALGVGRERILQSQNTVDERCFQTAAAPVWDLPRKPVVLYVGQFIARKGVSLLLAAAATLQREGHGFSLLLVGSGPDRDALERESRNLALKNVHFKLAQPPDRMPGVYRSGDLLALPTLEDVWGLVVNEAILSGVPVLCSRYAGCAVELLPPENIFCPDDPEEFVEKLRLAVTGKLKAAEPARLRALQDLSKEIALDLHTMLNRRFMPPIQESEPSSIR